MTGLTTRTGGAVGVACAVLWAFSVVPACAATPLPLTVSTQTSVISEVILPPSGGAQDTFNDTATLSGAPAGMPAPTGTVTFDVYGPYAVFGGPLASTPTCTGTPLSTSTDPIGPEGSATSSTFTSQGAGEYALTASYSGDAVYGAVTSACNAPNESVTVPIVGYAAPGSPSTQPGSAPSSPTPATPITPTPARLHPDRADAKHQRRTTVRTDAEAFRLRRKPRRRPAPHGTARDRGHARGDRDRVHAVAPRNRQHRDQPTGERGPPSECPVYCTRGGTREHNDRRAATSPRRRPLPRCCARRDIPSARERRRQPGSLRWSTQRKAPCAGLVRSPGNGERGSVAVEHRQCHVPRRGLAPRT